MDKSALKQIILEQKELFEKDEEIIRRVIPENILKSNKVIVITGIRRCGKSTLLRQISKKYKTFFYFNFEDERLLNFTYNDFNTLLQAFFEINPAGTTFFFDEIQTVAGWEKFVRRMFNENYKIFVTGSNASLLSSEIATSLTGRNLQLCLYPFSFKEYLSFTKFPAKEIYTTKEKAMLSELLHNYLKYGGFPEVIKSKDMKELSQIYQDIIIKDVLVRFKIRDSKDFRELSLYLMSNAAKKISFNKLKNLLNFNSTTKVKNYVDFLSQTYLIFLLPKYSPSLKKQLVNDRKVYSVDTGLVNAVSFQFSENKGRLLENAVFLELLRNNNELFYFEEKNECDFVIKKGTKIIEAIQAAADISSPETRKREIEGLSLAMKEFNLKTGLIITENTEDIIEDAGRKIQIIPLWKFLLTREN